MSEVGSRNDITRQMITRIREPKEAGNVALCVPDKYVPLGSKLM